MNILKEKTDDEILLSENEVWDVLSFAKNFAGDGMYSILTPMLINQRMKDITLNPYQATETSLTHALNDPKNAEITLQAFSQDFEIQSQVYSKLISYLSTILSFDMSYTCINANYKEYTSKAYQKDLDIVKEFFDKFDYKKEFSTVVKELVRSESYFGCPRFDGSNYVLQELPTSPQYTMITGRWDYGLLFSFNMYWFVAPGVDINMYPKFFINKFKDFWGGANHPAPYKPALQPANRGSSAFVFWQDIPVDVGWSFKFSPERATRVPPLSGIFLDLIQQPLMRSLQKNINMSVASRLIMGQVGMLKETKASTKDQFNINPELLGKFLSLVKTSIGDSLKVAAAPLENIQAINFPAENGVYNYFLKTALASSGVNTNLIFTSDTRPNSIESQLSLNVDENQLYNLYPQFEMFLNYHVNRLTKNYKFKFAFEGSQFYNNRSLRLEAQVSLASNGIVLPNKIAAAIGMNPFDFQRQLEEAQSTGWADKLKPIISAFQSSGKEDAGRPKKADSELQESGEITRSAGSNEK